MSARSSSAGASIRPSRAAVSHGMADIVDAAERQRAGDVDQPPRLGGLLQAPLDVFSSSVGRQLGQPLAAQIGRDVLRQERADLLVFQDFEGVRNS